MSQAPLRISSNRLGSNDASVDGPSHDRVEPDIGSPDAVVVPDVTVFLLDDARRLLGELGRYPAVEDVARLDDVVVDRDEGVAAAAGARDRAAAPYLAACVGFRSLSMIFGAFLGYLCNQCKVDSSRSSQSLDPWVAVEATVEAQ